MRRLPSILPAYAVLAVLSAAYAAETVTTVTQKDRAFSVKDVSLSPGGRLRFTNDDDFPHQVHVRGPNLDVDSPLQDKGQSIEVEFPEAGLFDVRCGIHPRMKLSVSVK